MVAATGRGKGKTAFVEQYLDAHPQANTTAVNLAWGEAGNPGSISSTLVQRIRSEKGLTGNIRTGRKPAGAEDATGPAAAPRAAAKQTRAAKAKANGKAKPLANGEPATEARPRVGGRNNVLVEIEEDLDRLIYKLIAVGGLEQVEDALRRVRRLVVRSHKG